MGKKHVLKQTILYRPLHMWSSTVKICVIFDNNLFRIWQWGTCVGLVTSLVSSGNRGLLNAGWLGMGCCAHLSPVSSSHAGTSMKQILIRVALLISDASIVTLEGRQTYNHAIDWPSFYCSSLQMVVLGLFCKHQNSHLTPQKYL